MSILAQAEAAFAAADRDEKLLADLKAVAERGQFVHSYAASFFMGQAAIGQADEAWRVMAARLIQKSNRETKR